IPGERGFWREAMSRERRLIGEDRRREREVHAISGLPPLIAPADRQREMRPQLPRILRPDGGGPRLAARLEVERAFAAVDPVGGGEVVALEREPVAMRTEADAVRGG